MMTANTTDLSFEPAPLLRCWFLIPLLTNLYPHRYNKHRQTTGGFRNDEATENTMERFNRKGWHGTRNPQTRFYFIR